MNRRSFLSALLAPLAAVPLLGGLPRLFPRDASQATKVKAERAKRRGPTQRECEICGAPSTRAIRHSLVMTKDSDTYRKYQPLAPAHFYCDAHCIEPFAITIASTDCEEVFVQYLL